MTCSRRFEELRADASHREPEDLYRAKYEKRSYCQWRLVRQPIAELHRIATDGATRHEARDGGQWFDRAGRRQLTKALSHQPGGFASIRSTTPRAGSPTPFRERPGGLVWWGMGWIT